MVLLPELLSSDPQDFCAPLLLASAAVQPPAEGASVVDAAAAVHTALMLVLKILFFANLRPVHRQLLAQLLRLPPSWQAAACDWIVAQVGEIWFSHRKPLAKLLPMVSGYTPRLSHMSDQILSHNSVLQHTGGVCQ